MFAKQRIKTPVALFIASFAALVISLFALSANAGAQAANTLRVSPVRTDIIIQPGTSDTVETTVTNLTDNEITVRPVSNDFIAGDERGTPALILDEDEFAPVRSLKRLTGPLSEITIPAGQTVTVPVVITVPENAPAGGYFGAVRFAPTTGDSGGQVNLSASVASLILMTVPGDTTEQLDLTGFTITQNGSAGAYFGSNEGIAASVRFENKGNVQLGPFGKVSVKQGNNVIYEADFNNKDQRDVVLPDSARVWDIPLENVGTFGYFTVLATFTYGSTNQTIEVSKSFWVIPPAFIIGVIVLVLLIIGAIVAAVLLRRNRRHKTRSFQNGRRR